MLNYAEIQKVKSIFEFENSISSTQICNEFQFFEPQFTSLVVLLFWSCKHRFWFCYFGLVLKNLVLFTSLLMAPSTNNTGGGLIDWHKPEGFVERSIPADEWTWNEENEIEDGEAECDAWILCRIIQRETLNELRECTDQVQKHNDRICWKTQINISVKSHQTCKLAAIQQTKANCLHEIHNQKGTC